MTRTPLRERGGVGGWNAFERLLFTLVTSDGTVPGYFSNRMAVTQAMLDAYDAKIAELVAKEGSPDAHPHE